MGDLHEDCLAVSAADMTATWVDATYLEEQDLGERGSIPIWANPLGEYARVAMTSGERAIVNGLRNRPMRETTRDTLRWWETLPDERTASPRAGLSAELENELLEGWKKKNA
jgi:hypothetical protein